MHACVHARVCMYTHTRARTIPDFCWRAGEFAGRKLRARPVLVDLRVMEANVTRKVPFQPRERERCVT